MLQTDSLIDLLQSETPATPKQLKELDRLIEAASNLDPVEAAGVLNNWKLWRRPDQTPPPGDWSTWLVMGGRGAGKTRTGAEWVREQVMKGYKRIALVAETAADARDVMVEGESGILAISHDGDRDNKGVLMGRPNYEPSKRSLTWTNGARAWTYNAREPGQLRGPQHDAAWCFVAGTMVATPDGERPIETLYPGDLVLTRNGARRVVANASRPAVVGLVKFSNGAELLGTREHPVYTPHGWTRMDHLRGGEKVCANRAERNSADSGRPSVCAVVPNSPRAKVSFAVSVASTWRPMGQQKVFCLKVDGDPEYFANGILVHNCDEIAKWRYPDAWDQVMFGLRLGKDPRALATTTPRNRLFIRQIMDDAHTVTTGASTYANRANLADKFIERIITRYEGTRLGRQELYGELLTDVPGALWNLDQFDKIRVDPTSPEAYRRIVVAVDPAASTEEGSDETGIVVAGVDAAGLLVILADLSGRYTPDEWGQKAVQAYDRWMADKIVGERNNGGDMVANVVRGAAKDMKANGKRPTDTVAFRSVWASKGKALRAEPIAALYEQNRARHAGIFTELEDQMAQMTIDFNRKSAGYSPDRLDAMVWAATDLMLGSGTPLVGAAEIPR
jgi:phage terminase large subunit-like protein